MSVYDHRCGDCSICPACGKSAWCEGDRILVVPCEHHGYCGSCNLDNCAECRIEVGLERAIAAAGAAHDRPGDDSDPWGPLAAESRADNERFWRATGERKPR